MERKDKNFIENAQGGIDCHRFIPSINSYAMYTMTGEESQEAINSGVEIIPLDQTVKDYITRRLALTKAKRVRDGKLLSLTYTFPDGREIQTRPKDAGNIGGAISRGEPRRWTMEDNTVSILTIAELQEAYQAGGDAINAIWDEYHDIVEAL